MVPLLRGLVEEKIVLLTDSQKSKLPFSLSGIVRLVDRKGRTIGLVLNKETMDEIEEEAGASNSKFLASLERSRRSGRVPGKEVKHKIGLK